MKTKTPILLSFYALTNGHKLMVFGHLTFSFLDDLSFKGFSTTKTFFTLFSLYTTGKVTKKEVELVFNNCTLKTLTDDKGSFYLETTLLSGQTNLTDIQINGIPVRFMDELYDRDIHIIPGSTILVSDIDDTVIHSFIANKFRKFVTLMFTSMERRMAVEPTMKLINGLRKANITPFYLSNSEQNLHPLIFRFLRFNNFPRGPLFLKEMRRLRDVFRGKKFPEQNLHKLNTLNLLISFFPDKKFILIGDNTQQDLIIYLTMADKFPDNVRYIVILKVIDRKEDDELVEDSEKRLAAQGIGLYYGKEFPGTTELMQEKTI
jgi:phosphatidate phosphatase APP1